MTPEQRGISSKSIEHMVRKLQKKQVPMHSLLIARGDDIVYEAYWMPFTKDTLHRMNSITKSYVGLAIGLLAFEGKLSLDDKITKFFPESENMEVDKYTAELTVRDLMCMKSACSKESGHWIRDKRYDRIADFFTLPQKKPRNTLFRYDTAGSYILTVIAERLSGKSFIEYLKEKALLKIGFSDNTDCIKDYAGYSWGDSGLLCTTRDLFLTARLIANGGVWNGKRLMDEEFLRLATTPLANTCTGGWNTYTSNGYGYQIWCEADGGFAFHGMGNQLMVCIPKKDITIVCTADTQGFDEGRHLCKQLVYDFIEELSDKPLPEDKEAYASLCEYTKTLRLISLDIGSKSSATSDKINGKKYLLDDNAMGIKWIRLDVNGSVGSFAYENEQGEKVIPFSMHENVFCEFPEDGYYNMRLGEYEEGYRHPVAVSASWLSETELGIKIQFGLDGKRLAMHMVKNTNCFLDKYNGYAVGISE